MENIKGSLFDVMTVPLEGSNLIEASAGTGKTFSIAILVLRLLLRQYESGAENVDRTPIHIHEILMVTFTTAAVAELESRIRKYIYIAEKYVSANDSERDGIRSENPIIATIVDDAILHANNPQSIKQILRDNLLLLDEANIMTIHSFCQSTLNEFAMETNQLFGVELFTDTDRLLEDEVNKFWRKHVTTLDSSILRLFDLEKKRQDIKAVVKSHLEGKTYGFYDAAKDYSKIDFANSWQEVCNKLEKEKEIALSSLATLLENIDIQDIIVKSAALKKNKEKYLSVVDSIASFIEVYSSDSSKIKNDLPPALKIGLDAFLLKNKNSKSYAMQLFFVDINNLAIQEIIQGYSNFLHANNYVTYDQLIGNLHTSLLSSNSDHLKQKLNNKYKAVFVDEFQDTDRRQYDIFFETFSREGILFLIGDAKQSIYGWRKADLLTYFKARQDVGHLYNMNINYRSSKNAIDAMNLFFQPYQGFDTFLFENRQQRIDYTFVEVPDDSAKGSLDYKAIPCKGMQLVELNSKSEIFDQVSTMTLQLLVDKNYSLNGRQIQPSDIGIIVRTNLEAVQLKRQLVQKNIPSVVVNEEKVLDSAEAIDVLYLLHAVLTPSLSKINRFLMSDLVGFDYRKLLLIDDSSVLDIFQELNIVWIKNGVYPMLVRFSTIFSLEEKWMNRGAGERILTNFLHVTELLNQMEKKKNYSPEELVAWLQRSINGVEHSGDEYELRMESDENAVKIVTIHKSKGLEYNIVIAPFLDLNSTLTASRNFVQFYDETLSKHITKDVLLLSNDEIKIYKIEQERENRRLVYVAITRAVYQCYVFHSKREKNSSLAAFFEALRDQIECLGFTDSIDEQVVYNTNDISHKINTLQASHFDLLDKDWFKLSFTGLSYHAESSIKERTKSFTDNYDAFVFDQLKFGAASGNLLHNLLEEIDFTNNSKYDEVINKVLKKYLPNEIEKIIPNIQMFLDHVLNVQINVGEKVFCLKEIQNYKRLSELEFDFFIQDFDYQKLPFLLGNFFPIQTRYFDYPKLQGLMNGKIDLFFEQNGRYYILDWKSNYLGFDLEDYNLKGMLNAMNENNYHLQYLLYIIAAKKMLESRLPYFNYEKQFGGVIYLFLRGVRKNSKSGIFTCKPPYNIILSLEHLLG